MRTPGRFIALGAASAAAAVAMGAFGAHALKARLAPDLLAIFHTAFQYHLAHSLGLVLVGLAGFHWPDSRWLRASGWLMLGGVVLFSGSLYALSLTGARAFGAITPIGGMAFIAAWVLLAVAVRSDRRRSNDDR
jgi:uncharacterized membrane protein YgdD (TMEM256/DUF423 family)